MRLDIASENVTSSIIILHLIFVFSRFRRPASFAPLCQPHPSPVRSLSYPESIAAVQLYLPKLLFHEVVLAPRPSDRFPSADFCLRVGFFFASFPLLNSTIFATSDRDDLNTAHTQRYYSGYRLRTYLLLPFSTCISFSAQVSICALDDACCSKCCLWVRWRPQTRLRGDPLLLLNLRFRHFCDSAGTLNCVPLCTS